MPATRKASGLVIGTSPIARRNFGHIGAGLKPAPTSVCDRTHSGDRLPLDLTLQGDVGGAEVEVLYLVLLGQVTDGLVHQRLRLVQGSGDFPIPGLVHRPKIRQDLLLELVAPAWDGGQGQE